MADFRFIEAFYSLQGEGLHVGVPSVFVRLFGCNFTCQGFGMPRGEVSNEYLQLDPKQYTSLDQVPLVRTGCDSFVAWDPRWKHLTKDMSAAELASHLTNLTPDNNWGDGDIHLVITGGEPLLGWQKNYIKLFEQKAMSHLWDVTFETNTTQPLHPELRRAIWDQTHGIRYTFSCSPKLSVSGEKWDQAIRPDIARAYNDVADHMYFKFVVASKEDIDEVEAAVAEYASAGVNVPVYLMPVGGCKEEYEQNMRLVANEALARGYRYSPRLHVDIWGNQWAT